MDFSGEEDGSSAAPGWNVIRIDPSSELVLETPPPDVVSSIDQYFQQLKTCSLKKSGVSSYTPSDSDSGEGLFVTQSVATSKKTGRQLGSPQRTESVLDYESQSVNRRLSETLDDDHQERSRDSCVPCPRKTKHLNYAAPRRATFPFLSNKKQHLPLVKHKILENSEIGGFFKCIKKIQEGNVKLGTCLDLEEDDDGELEDDCDHEVRRVDRKCFVLGLNTGKKSQWLPQPNAQDFWRVKGKDKQSKTTSKDQIRTNDSVKKTNRNSKLPKTKVHLDTANVSAFEEHEQEFHTVLAPCSDAELSDSFPSGQPRSPKITQSALNLPGDHDLIILETQDNSMELDDNMSSAAKNQSDDSYSLLPQPEGDVSSRNEVEHTESDFGSLDLFSSPSNHEIHETISSNSNLKESSQDSDLTQIENESQIVFGSETQRSLQDYVDSDATQIENATEKQFTTSGTTTSKQPEAYKRIPGEAGFKKSDNGEMVSKCDESPSSMKTVYVQPPYKHLPADEPSQAVVSSPCERGMAEEETDTPLFKYNGPSFLKRKRHRACIKPVQKDLDIESLVDDNLRPLMAHKENYVSREVENGEQTEDLHPGAAASPVEDGIYLLLENSDVTKRKKMKNKANFKDGVEPSEENQLLTEQTPKVTKNKKWGKSQTAHEEDHTSADNPPDDAKKTEDTELTPKRTKTKKKYKRGSQFGLEDEKKTIDDSTNEAFETDRPGDQFQFSERQTNETQIRKKKKKKDKKRAQMAIVEDQKYTHDPTDEAPDSNGPEDNVQCNVTQTIETIGVSLDVTNQLLSSEEVRCSSANATRLVSGKKKKKKKKKKNLEINEKDQNESVELNGSTVSPFDDVIRLKNASPSEFEPKNNSESEHLNTKGSVQKRKKKHRILESQTEVDDLTGFEKSPSEFEPQNNSESEHLNTKGSVQKHKKKHRILESQTEVDDLTAFEKSPSEFEPQNNSESEHLNTKGSVQKHKKKHRILESQTEVDDLTGFEKSPSEFEPQNNSESEHLNTKGSVQKHKKKRWILESRTEVDDLTAFEKSPSEFEPQNNSESEHLNTKGSVQKRKKKRQILESRTEVDDLTAFKKSPSEFEPQINSESEHLNTKGSVQKRKKKRQILESRTEVDDLTGFEKSPSEFEPQNNSESEHLNTKGSVQKHKKKRRILESQTEVDDLTAFEKSTSEFEPQNNSESEPVNVNQSVVKCKPKHRILESRTEVDITGLDNTQSDMQLDNNSESEPLIY
ncbi:hypothetical protein DNTS_024923 [Danionella cerebrum]|uniref:Uncharacterized protein n=1 Tax=Danionella cerebrum TaxID=2873325 RepID=A0A553MVV9_9TELE|nr:hypothetical protein DNTS_024923 [Danionella translucida]